MVFYYSGYVRTEYMLKDNLRKLFRRFGFDIVGYRAGQAQAPYPPDFEQQDIDIIHAVQPYTMTSPERMFALIQSIRYIVQNDIPGTFIECGVWRGGSMMAAALTLLQMNRQDRELYLFDTFEGMPPPSNQDINIRGDTASAILQDTEHPSFRNVLAAAMLDEVKGNMQQTRYDNTKIYFIQGRVEDTIPSQAPNPIALLRLDTDWYESTQHELLHLFPRLSPQGVLIIDDYGHWKGCREATDEYLTEHNITLLLNRIDYTGRIAVKGNE
jgi:hypothetical protein